MSNDRPAISVQDLARRFGPVTAVNGISLQVASGEVFGLVGPDGAGKTTVLRMLAGIMRPDTGRILIDGIDAVSDPETVKQHVSYMPQRFGLYEDLTVQENIRFYADLFELPRATWKQRAEDLLRACALDTFGGRLAGQLSGGMKQKLGLVCALVHAPRVLLLDEPTTGVDPVSRREFWEIVYGLREQGVAILISTAYLDEAERCDRLALLDRGHLVRCDTPAHLKASLPGAIIEIRVAGARELLPRVERLEGVRNALLTGDGMHVHVDDGATRLPQLTQLAAQAQGSAAEIEPSIEDVFVALLSSTEPA